MKNFEKFKIGDFVLAICEKNFWVFQLKEKGVFGTHFGKIDHKEILKLRVGERKKVGKKVVFFTKARLVDFINYKAKRVSQIIYPKDSSQMIFFGDLKENLKVLEIGVGSGALTLAILNFLGKKGRLVGLDYDKRMIKAAKENVEKFLKAKNFEFKIMNVYEGINLKEKFDRIFIDIPDPAKIVKFLPPLIKNSGLIINYCVQADQLQKLVIELRKHNFFVQDIFETIKRDWLVDEKRLRAKELIRGYSAFITIARPTLQ